MTMKSTSDMRARLRELAYSRFDEPDDYDRAVILVLDDFDDAFRAGRIKQAEEDAKILRDQLAEATRPDQRMTLAIAIRAIERGRNLTEVEKMKNLMDALVKFDREESARLRAEGEGEPK